MLHPILSDVDSGQIAYKNFWRRKIIDYPGNLSCPENDISIRSVTTYVKMISGVCFINKRPIVNGVNICTACFPMSDFVLTAHAQFVATERNIKLSWIEAVLTQPDVTETDPKDQELIHSLGKISENDGRVLRIIHSRTQPARIVTVYFDRSMRGKL